MDDDLSAIARCQRGDVAGLTVLMRRYEVSALRLAHLLTGDAFLAEDIVQDSFLQAYHAMGRFQAGRPFLPWFQRIVTNTTRMRLRAARRRREIRFAALADVDTHAPVGTASDVESNPVARAERIEERAAIAQALAALTEKQREAVALRYYFAYSDHEIATILGCNVSAARRRIYDGLHALDRVIRQRFSWLLSERDQAPEAQTAPPAAHPEGASA